MIIRHPTLHQLRIFTVLARHLNMTRAATELHQTPSALSIQIKQLSETAGEPLYEQMGKKLYLTAAGEAVARAGNDILRRLDALNQELNAQRNLESGTLNLSIISTAEYFAPRLIGTFCKEHAGIEVHLEIANRDTILERLKQNLDDIYIMGQVPDDIDGVARPFMDNPLVVLAPGDHPLAEQSRITPEQLKDEAFILREEGSGTRLTAQNFFQEQGVQLKVRMTMSSNEAVKQLVAGGLGLSVLSLNTIAAEANAGNIAILDVVGFPILRQWHAVHRKNKRLTAVAQKFMDFLLEGNY
ncbi:LysR family transcriptional regulator [Acidithiobacillus sulfurivorans]|uniref:LysR family transcriptional regulator n=1 Tax=Acidithiobacillus sulfurivorans TaxID=1958756 RepID=A0ABS6A322_9PROT|nr:LysR family transcriptional regulator [Acidithiobacillus sulfurivorans]MBU2761757.1 LysR family transcriptional regulator [Acidithiobacillus sulfurivorans]